MEPSLALVLITIMYRDFRETVSAVVRAGRRVASKLASTVPPGIGDSGWFPWDALRTRAGTLALARGEPLCPEYATAACAHLTEVAVDAHGVAR